jgi:hypothetical protein
LLLGEGITLVGSKLFQASLKLWTPSLDKIVQLTWREGMAFEYERTSLNPIRHFPFTTSTGEGWGITTSGDGVHTHILSIYIFSVSLFLVIGFELGSQQRTQHGQISCSNEAQLTQHTRLTAPRVVHAQKEVFVTDGSDVLHVWDAATLRETRRLRCVPPLSLPLLPVKACAPPVTPSPLPS